MGIHLMSRSDFINFFYGRSNYWRQLHALDSTVAPALIIFFSFSLRHNGHWRLFSRKCGRHYFFSFSGILGMGVFGSFWFTRDGCARSLV